MDAITFTLENNIKAIYEQSKNSEVTHCGIIINSGSRDENENQLGLAHFIEHTIFKGTSKRKSFHILNSIDKVGGEINAFTTKEQICIYTATLQVDFERALDLLADICFDASFPEKEIEKEKEVILDEINSYLDSPSEQIFDDFEDLLFKDHSLGHNILGTTESVKKMTREKILDFLKTHFSTENIVFSYVGPESLEKVKNKANKYFNHQNISTKRKEERTVFKDYNTFKIEKKNSQYQSHLIVGNKAYAKNDPKRPALILLNNLIGGPAMNSRLNLNIREKYGFTYNLESNYVTYSDAGWFGIYMGTDKKHLDKTLNLCLKELKNVREKELGIKQLYYAKKQILGQLAISGENNQSLMLSNGKNYATGNKIYTKKEVEKIIENISSKDLLEVANEIFEPNQLSYLSFQP
jgi:predicted Zn-dependent peptidase